MKISLNELRERHPKAFDAWIKSISGYIEFTPKNNGDILLMAKDGMGPFNLEIDTMWSASGESWEEFYEEDNDEERQ